MGDGSRAMSASSTASTSSKLSSSASRLARVRSSASVCGPRSISTQSTAVCRATSPIVSLMSCRYFVTREPDCCTARTSDRRRSESIAPATVASSYCTIGSRFEDWLHAFVSALSDSG